MELKQFDHIVLTTQDLERCLHFYRDVLGMRVREQDGRYALLFGSQKINIHRRKAEFLPAAAHPVYGSLDLCISPRRLWRHGQHLPARPRWQPGGDRRAGKGSRTIVQVRQYILQGRRQGCTAGHPI